MSWTLDRVALGSAMLRLGAAGLVGLAILFVLGVQGLDLRLPIVPLAAMGAGALVQLPGRGMGWRLFAVAQAVGVAIAGFLWLALRAGKSNGGPGIGFELVDGGVGLVIVGYLVVLVIAAVALFRGSRDRVLALAELPAVPALLVVIPLAVGEVSRGGSPDFYYALAALAMAAAALALVAGLRLAIGRH